MNTSPNGHLVTPGCAMAPRKVTMGVKGHFTGQLIVGDDEGRAMEVESHTEMQTALVMMARRDVVGLENQVPVSWTDNDGEQRTHFADFRICHRDGRRTILVVKNSKVASRPEFKRKIRRLASQITPDVADALCVYTEKDLDPIEVDNASLMYGARVPDHDADAAVRRVVFPLFGSARVDDLVERAGVGGRGFRAVVRLLRSHELELVNHERITPIASVRRRTR